MAISSGTYWNIRRLNWIFACSAILLLASIVWLIRHDYRRPWRPYQQNAVAWEVALLEDRIQRNPGSPDAQAAAQRLEQLTPNSRLARASDSVRSAPLLQFVNPKHRIRQVVTDDVLTDLSFARVSTTDRCITCHVNIDRPEFERGRIIAFLENQLDDAGESNTIELFWQTWGDALLNPLSRRAARSMLEIRQALERQFGPAEQTQLEETYRRFLLQQVNALRIESGQSALDASPALLAHPKLDLHIADDSPHALSALGCTSCHDGAGQETDFILAAHMPHEMWVDGETGAPIFARQVKAAQGQEIYKDPVTDQQRIAITQKEFWTRRFEPESGHTLEQARRDCDRPMLPLDYTQASCARCHPQIHDIRDEAPILFEGRNLFSQNGCSNCHGIDGFPADDRMRIGPDLRRVGSKLSLEFIEAWIWSPRTFRPTSRMPHEFMLENNSSPEDIARTNAEVRAIARYLIEASSPAATQPAMPSPDKTSQERVARGRVLFIGVSSSRAEMDQKQGGLGCIGCHSIPQETGGITIADQGPELATIAARLTAGRSPDHARRWLVEWLFDPKQYAPQTRMPSMRLSLEQVLDLAEYLLSLRRPITIPAAADLSDTEILSAPKLIEQYGCANCHLIPGLESAVSSCPNLTGWGQKRAEQLDFGNRGQVPPIDQSRIAWLEQKLKNPRIFDRGRVHARPTEKLRMPAFAFTDQQVHAIVTFIVSNRDPLVTQRILSRANTEAVQDIARGRQITQRLGCVGCHDVDGNQPAIRRYWTGGGGMRARFDAAEMVTRAPPSLRGEGARVQHPWLYSYLRNVEAEGIAGRIRPLPFIRMPSFSLTDDQTTTLVRFFASAARREAARLNQRLNTLRLKDDQWPPDGWFRQPSHANVAANLRAWALKIGVLRPAEFAGRGESRAYQTALFDARFISQLFQTPYPFTNTTRPVFAEDRFTRGEQFFHQLQCQSCHVVGDEKSPAVNQAPRGPNLSLAHRRLQPRWIRRWLQETQVVQPGAIMPPFFSGRAAADVLSLESPVFRLEGLPYMVSPLTAEQVALLQAQFGRTADDQAQLLIDFLWMAGQRDYTSPDPTRP